jgi:hypothetical protein
LLIVFHLDQSACFNFRFDRVIVQIQYDAGSLAIDLQFRRIPIDKVVIAGCRAHIGVTEQLADSYRRVPNPGRSRAWEA